MKRLFFDHQSPLAKAMLQVRRDKEPICAGLDSGCSFRFGMITKQYVL